MTQMEFNFYILFGIFRKVADACTGWFDDLMSAVSGYWFYLSAVAIFTLVRLLLSPLLGSALAIGASDSVRAHKELSRHRGKYEKGGKYLRK